MTSRGPFHLVVVGGGASAVQLIYALAKHAVRATEVTLIDRAATAGLGRAYSTHSDVHYLNVPAGNMSGDAEDSSHFLNWLNAGKIANRQWKASDFALRKHYGEYLQSLLQAARGKLAVNIIHGIVTEIRAQGDSWLVALDDGRAFLADVVALATGNEAPTPVRVPGADAVRSRLIDDPWDAKAKEKIPHDARVMLLGAGLTAIDIAMELFARNHGGEIVAVSRRALFPRFHDMTPRGELWISPPYPSSVCDLFNRIREHVGEGAGWQGRFDAMRPVIPALWDALTPNDKRRFLRHLRTLWNVHRHRGAPEVGVEISAALSRGKMRQEKGRLRELQPASRGFRAIVQHGRARKTIEADVFVNCMEPNASPARSTNPLLANLIGHGVARSDAVSLGLDVDAQSRVVSHAGEVHPSVFALGPLAIGRFWEITAIPEIRVQAGSVAKSVAALAETVP